MAILQSAPFMPPIRNTIIFGDLTYNSHKDLQSLLHFKDNAGLLDFFTRVSFAFRHEFASLSQQEQEWLPRFTNLTDLLENVSKSEGAPAVRFALLCVYQIGRFICHFGRPDAVYPTYLNADLLGLCTGSFAAAAVSTSQTISELIPAAVEAVILAFRTGLHSFRLERDFRASSDTTPQQWSAVVSVSEQVAVDLIEHYVQTKGIPKRLCPFVSAVGPSNVTISGPPKCLQDLFQSTTPRAHFLSIESPYHAPHLYDSGDVAEVLSKPMNEKLKAYSLRIPIISPASGNLITECRFEDLLHLAVNDTLREQIRWDKILPAYKDRVSRDEPGQICNIFPCASNAAPILSSTLSSIPGKAVSINNAINAGAEAHHRAVPTGRFGDSKIAVVGFSGRFPDAASNDEFWELLRSGKDAHRTIPEDRFDWEAHFDPSGATKNTSRVKMQGMFDARFFHLSPREAEDTDPAQRLALMTTYEALEMAGFVPDRTPSSQRDRVGVFYGTTSDDWREVNSGQDVGTYFIPGGNRAFVPGRITFFFRFSGPSISVDTACSSSFAALHTACQSLLQGGCDTAIAGGTNILTNPDNFAGLDRGHFLSTTGNCNPFDDDASGYCRADAVGSVVLKRLEDAEADKDPIFGVIAGVNTNHCGQTVSITRPHEGDQLALFKRILRQSNTNPIDVNYVEMHGTGTQAGDAAEMTSVLTAMAPSHERMPHHPLYLGAVKANVGHSESASGVSALIKVLMMMQRDEIPPHVGIKGRINRNYPLDLKARNVNIAFKPTPWKRTDYPSGKRVSFLNNFSAAGGNTAVLLEDAPVKLQRGPGFDNRGLHPVVISANSSKSLKANMSSLLNYLEKHPDTSPADLSYTTTARRIHHKFRFSMTCKEIASVKGMIKNRLGNEDDFSAIPSGKRTPSVVFAFTGQGNLYAGLGKQLYETIDSFRQHIRRFDRIAQQYGFPSFLPIITSGSNDVIIEDIETISAHLALVCVQMALYRLWVSWGVLPSLTTGHSLGEYPALYAAGVLSASDVIYLIGTRATLLSSRCDKGSHSMLVVKAPLSAVDRIAAESSCDIACVNSPSNTVISGPRRQLDSALEALRAEGLECFPLSLPYAFHSAQVDSWVEEFKAIAGGVQYNTPTVPYMSPLHGTVISAGEASFLNGDYLARASRATVNFLGAVEAANTTGMVNDNTHWLEIGSHPACSNFVRHAIGSKSITLPSLKQNMNPWETLIPALQTFYLGGLDIQWSEYHRSLATSQQVLPLPSYNWDLKNYWIMYRGNFCLTKGDDVIPAKETPASSPVESYLSSSVHRVIEEHHTKDKSTVLTESNIHDPRLRPIFQGHKVNGTALCPSSLYADMATTIVRYILQANNMPSEDIGIDCGHMKVDRSLILSPESTSQLLRVSATADWQRGEVSLSLFSVGAESRKLADHVTCLVKVTQAPAAFWLQEWKRIAHLIRGRISALQKGVDDGHCHKLKRGLAYKLFDSLVEYSPDYQGMQEVVFDTEGFEATAQVVFQVGENGFSWNPCWIDSLGHIAGFIMNGSDNIHAKGHVFINHGWSKMRCAKPIEHGKTYQTYNKMQPEDDQGNMYVGDTYILENGNIVAIFEGVKFQRIARAVLDHLLPSKPRQNQTEIQRQSAKIQAKPVSKPKAAPGMPKPVSSATSSQTNTIMRLKTIISEEAGIAITELDLETSFTDFGVDSLLSLTISGRMQEELGLNISSSSFIEYPTLGEMVNHFAPSEFTSYPVSETSTPYSEKADYDLGDETDATSVDEEADVMSTIGAIIAEEVGVPRSELAATTDLSELGVDSLLSLTIVGRLNEAGIKAPSDLLASKHTLQEIEETLSPTPKSRTSRTTKAALDEASESIVSSGTQDPSPHATSVRLQGSSKSPAGKTVFLFPDGAGSATSYTSLPDISPDVVVYGLNCPWMRTPENLRCTLPQYVSKFITEIRRRQSSGPYIFGGWSAGGILAYEAAQQLAREGETTAKLILLDSPDPIGIQSPPQRMYDFLESLDMFGLEGRKPPAWLRPHFTAFITMLDQYRPLPFAGKPIPQTHIIYARDGICKNPEDVRPEVRPDDPREMHWLLNNRTDFSGGGWRQLLGATHLQSSVVDNANHYTMLAKAESAAAVRRLIGDFLES
ncbi:MAG: Type I Iterative PKS [Bogoriella megaspora]|nr:MAG: Type I Iterative PKS [Bogoriella megaspora]